MLKLIQKFICNISTGKTVLVLLLLTCTVYFLMLFVTIPLVTEYSDGMKILDMMPSGYDLDYVKKLFTTLGFEGRHAYFYYQLRVDLIFPTLFAISFCLLFCYLLKKIQRHQSTFFYISFLPVIAGVSDYIENFGIITMLQQFPDIQSDTVAISNTFSLLKSTTTTFYFFALIIIIITVLVKHFMRGKKIRLN